MNTEAIFVLFIYALLFPYYRKYFYLHPGIGLFHPTLTSFKLKHDELVSKSSHFAIERQKLFKKLYKM